MKIYIRSSACISPQKTFSNNNFLTDVIEYTGKRLKAIEPDYKEFVDPKALRRMSHIIKMGLAASLQCLRNGNTEMPGAIITGTAYGCLEDTITFLSRMIEQNEDLLPPTPFIQSTHNTVASQIALQLKCHNYNNTFVHKGISFESALIDAIMLLKEHEADNILVGGTDEMTDTSFTILTRLGLYKRWPVSNLQLYATKSKGSIGGEGSAFFLLTDKASENNLAELTAIRTIYLPRRLTNQRGKPTGIDEIEKRMNLFLAEHSLKMDDIDLVITGKSGDIGNDDIYEHLNRSLFKSTDLANYKHLSGEYPTSVAFALWLAANCIKNKMVPETVVVRQAHHEVRQAHHDIERRTKTTSPKRILIYNHYQKIYHSLMLVSAI